MARSQSHGTPGHRRTSLRFPYLVLAAFLAEAIAMKALPYRSTMRGAVPRERGRGLADPDLLPVVRRREAVRRLLRTPPRGRARGHRRAANHRRPRPRELQRGGEGRHRRGGARRRRHPGLGDPRSRLAGASSGPRVSRPGEGAGLTGQRKPCAGCQARGAAASLRGAPRNGTRRSVSASSSDCIFASTSA